MPLGEISGRTVTLAELAILAVGIYYLTLSPKLGFAMIAFSALFDVVARDTPWGISVTLFVFGWIMQFIGHYKYEKRSPAFFKNFLHLLVGPLVVLNWALGLEK